MTPTRQPVSAAPGLRPPLATSDYAALRDFVDRAAQGEIDLQRPSSDLQADLPLPSGWYAAAPTPAPVRALRPEARAAAFGLGAGLLVLVPWAIWSQIGPSAPSRDSGVFMTSIAPGATDSVRDPTIDVVQVRTIPTTAAAADPTIDEAQQLLRAGDVIGARTTLSTAAAARNPVALFVMAETYDPNMLAAWGARGVGADAERARALYAAAQALGHEKAAGRLQSLR